MADSKTHFLPLLATVASAFLLSGSVHSTPQPPSTSRAPPPQLPQYYPTSSQRPPSSPYPPTSSLAPTSPVYTAQRIRPNSYSDSAEYDDPYPASAHLGTARTTSGVARGEEDAPENTGFVEPIDFSSLLKDVGSSPKGVGLDIGASSTNPLFASESKDTFQGFFGSTKNPFEELSRLNTASSDHNSRRQNGEEDNTGFVDPNVQFRSLFDSAGPSASSTGFRPQDFLGSKSENIGSDPSKGSQTRAYPSFTYSGRKDGGGDREDSDRDDYYNRGGGGGGGGPSRYRSSYRQVGDGSGNNYYPPPPPTSNSSPDYYGSPGGDSGSSGPYDDYDRISHDSPSDSYDDERSDGPSGPSSGGSYYSPSSRSNGRGGGGYERATPRYVPSAQETSNSPQTKPRAAESKSPKCKKVEKSVDYSDDHASFTDPEPDYDPSTYQGRYKRQTRQRGGRGGSKRPMTCYVCEDEHGRYAEKCSYDSKGSPSNKDGNYFHSESSSFSDNGRRPNYGSGSSSSKQRSRRNPGGNRQRPAGDIASAESTTKSVSAIAPENHPEVGESEPKVIEKRQSGGGFDDDFRENPHRGGGGDENPYDASTGAYRHPSGYEGPPLSSIGGASTNRVGGGGYHGGGGGGYHGRGGGGRGGYHGDNDYHGGRSGSSGGGGRDNDGFDSDFNFGSAPDYEREAAQATREYDFTIPREFDPDVQLGPQRGGGGNNRRGSASTSNSPQSNNGGGGGGNGPQFQPEYYHSNPNRRGGPQQTTSSSNRRQAVDEFDIGYNDYVKQNFPEIFNSPSFGASTASSPSSFSRDYEFTPNYYHRPRGGNNEGSGHRDDRGQGPEVSHSSPSDNYGRGYHRGGRGEGGGGRGGFVPDKSHTQPSHNFAPPPGFFSEDSPGQENYENLGNIMKDFSSRSRDGCQKVNKGDMTCLVCRDAKGMKKEECVYASNDPKNKAIAYHEVAEYSSPTASVLPAPLHATLLGQPSEDSPIFSAESDEDGGSSSTLSAEASSIFHTSTPAATTVTSDNDKKAKSSASTSSVVTAKYPLTSSATVLKAKKVVSNSNSKDNDKDKNKNVRSVKSSRVVHSSTVIVHERSKRSLKQTPSRKIQSEVNYDFDY